jgi:hypothetical protein
MNRPEKTEYNPYYETYVSLVPEAQILSALEKQQAELVDVFKEIGEDKAAYSYAEGKWTIKELIGHLSDGERIFGYRALRIARADETPLEGFEQDGYIENSNFKNTKLSDLTAELLYLRKANLIFFQNLTSEAWQRTGTASDSKVSVRALAFIMVGHIRHHLNILKTRYLAK